MTRLQETLLILHHFDSLISGRTDFCRRNIDFNISDCVTQKLLERVKAGVLPSELNSESISSVISRECADVKVILHSYISLNIIDMFSFNDEYNDFFNQERFDDIDLKQRVKKVKDKNKVIRKSFNWDLLSKIRNNVLAHNMRDKKNGKVLSLETLKELYNISSNIKYAIEYSEVTMKLFDNIKEEFEVELTEAQKVLMTVIRNTR
jgi:hypothetical protein